MAIIGALLHRDQLTMSLTAAGRNECGLVTTKEVDVAETAAEVRITAQERTAPTLTTGPIACALTGGPLTVPLEVHLQQPLGDRTVLDGPTGSAVRPVRATDELVPVAMAADWAPSEEHFSSTSTIAEWSVRYGPANQQGMFFGVWLTIRWGPDCAAATATGAGGPTVVSTPVTLRGVEASLVDSPGTPTLTWAENGTCIQLVGSSVCTPQGCQVVDRDLLITLAASLAPARPPD